MHVLDLSSGEEKLEPPPRHATQERPDIDKRRPPPRGGLPLGTVLGVTISVLVALVLGGLTTVQQHRGERRERTARQKLLAESLAPVAAEIERASNLDEIERCLSASARAENIHGHSDFNLILTGADGRVVGAALAGADSSPPPGSLLATMSVRSPWLASGRGTLTAWQDSGDLSAEITSRRRVAWLDIGIAVLVIIIGVQLTIYVLVTRPLNHLLTSIHKVEMGYPATLRKGDIARELRWLGWRFHDMSANLTNSARLLVAAHRRAVEASRSMPNVDIDPELLDPLGLKQPGRSAEHEILRRYLRNRCAQLEGYQPGDSRARQIAFQMWEHDAVEAEKMGEMDLRSRIENAALAVLEPRTFERACRDLDKLVDARSEWCAATEEFIRSSLAEDGLSQVVIQRRTKHVGGVLRKMREKNLLFEEVHDLFAFRIIVPNTEGCYVALQTVHRCFEPEPFRFKDYIAHPKANGYQSLHTSVRDRHGFVFEVQIRTVDMHRSAEEGTAAHWRYRSHKPVRV